MSMSLLRVLSPPAEQALQADNAQAFQFIGAFAKHAQRAIAKYRLLRNLGANRDIRDNFGKTASDYYNKNR